MMTAPSRVEAAPAWRRLPCWLGLAALAWAVGASAAARSGADLLPESEYATSLEEVIVHGQRAPAWRDRVDQGPRWERPELDLSEPEPPRLQWFPPYTRDERDNYDGVRDRRAAEPRLRVFELKF